MPAVRAFIVEDSPVILENLIGALKELANVDVVASASDEPSAVAWLKSQGDDTADLMIVDIFLSAGTGLGVLEAVKKMELPTRRVVMTNYATQEMRERCTQLGAERVFDKSRELDDLIAYCAELAQDGATPSR